MRLMFSSWLDCHYGFEEEDHRGEVPLSSQDSAILATALGFAFENNYAKLQLESQMA